MHTPGSQFKLMIYFQFSNVSNIYALGSPTGDGITSLQDLFADDGSCLTKVEFNCREDVAVMPFSSGTTGLPKGNINKF